MRFSSPRDYQTMVTLNNELVAKAVDVNVIIYKQNAAKTKTNSYDEAPSKTWYARGVLVPALIDRGQTNPSADMLTTNIQQRSSFSFLRNMLWERNVYPEEGDIIEFDQHFYEIHNTNEIQLWAGQDAYNHAIVCETHLTRKKDLQLEKPIL